MARTLAQVQATLTTLYATYDALAAKIATEVSASGRSITYTQMESIRKEIENLESLEAQLTTAATVDTAPPAGVSFAKFEDAR